MTRTYKISKVNKTAPKIKKKSTVVDEKNGVKMTFNRQLFDEISDEEIKSLELLFKDNISTVISPFKDEISALAEKILKEQNLTMEDVFPEEKSKSTTSVVKPTKEINVDKLVRSQPDTSGTKTSQVKNGFVFGFKRQLVKNSSQSLARKMNSVTPFADSKWGERLWQICLLLGLAELFHKMPESIAGKIRLSEDDRLDIASNLRHLAGEQIGRDIVDLAEFVLPIVVEMVKDFSAEEIEDLADNLGSVDNLEDALTIAEDLVDDKDELESLFQLVEEDVTVAA